MCDLFPQQMIREWQERINPRQVLGQIQAEHAGHGLPCPSCRQFNAKVLIGPLLNFIYDMDNIIKVASICCRCSFLHLSALNSFSVPESVLVHLVVGIVKYTNKCIKSENKLIKT
jgi:hypothetical protein